MLDAIQVQSRYGNEQPQFADGRICLQGEREWKFTGDPTIITRIEAALHGLGERMDATLLLVNFRNAVGTFRVPGYGDIEVVSGKWTREHFNSMLQDLSRIAAGLPFSGPGAPGLPYKRDVTLEQDLLYHQFVYLRYILSADPPLSEQLLPALRHILRQPYNRLTRTRADVSLDSVHRLDPTSLQDLVAPRRGAFAVPPATAARLHLPAQLQRHLPQVVSESRIEQTLDNPENRFVKAFLYIVADIIERMRQHSSIPPKKTRQLRDQCDQLDQLLQPITRHSMWRDVGRMVHLPASSTVLQRRHGYREVFSHYTRLNLATRIPLDPQTIADLLESKDIAQLYELWCFFSVAEQLQLQLGRPDRAGRPEADTLQITAPHSLELLWRDKARLLYNASFSRSNRAQHSYSLPLRPDIALEIMAGPNQGLHLLDAKFKVDQAALTTLGNSSETDEATEAEERSGTFKRADLYKMHTYHDAIPHSRSVWILYPGTEFVFYHRPNEISHSLDALLTAPLVGVGALALRPDGTGTDQLSQLSEILLASAYSINVGNM